MSTNEENQATRGCTESSTASTRGSMIVPEAPAYLDEGRGSSVSDELTSVWGKLVLSGFTLWLFSACTADRRQLKVGDPRDRSDGESGLCERGAGDFDCARNCELRLLCSLVAGLSGPSTELWLASGLCRTVARFPSSVTRDDVCDILRSLFSVPFAIVRWLFEDWDRRVAPCLLVLLAPKVEGVSPTNLKLGVVASQQIPRRIHDAHCGFPSSHYH
jgi:hypothetical protein